VRSQRSAISLGDLAKAKESQSSASVQVSLGAVIWWWPAFAAAVVIGTAVALRVDRWHERWARRKAHAEALRHMRAKHGEDGQPPRCGGRE
jgi:hypothetical protein